MTTFNKLYTMDVTPFVKIKGKLKYLSWANAWRIFKETHNEATYRILWKEFEKLPDGTVIVKTEVTIMDMELEDEVTYEMFLPCMDHRNKAVANPDAFLQNKTIMRCLTKNLAMFGLGLSLYAGEDLPSEFDVEEATKSPTEKRFEKMLKAFEALGETKNAVLSFVGKKQESELTAADYKALADLYSEMKTQGAK